MKEQNIEPKKYTLRKNISAIEGGTEEGTHKNFNQFIYAIPFTDQQIAKARKNVEPTWLKEFEEKISMENFKKKLANFQCEVKNFENEYGAPGYYNKEIEFKTEYDLIASALIKKCPVLIYTLLDALNVDKKLIYANVIVSITDKTTNSTKGENGYYVSDTLTFLEKEDNQKMLNDKYNSTQHQQYYSDIISLIENTLIHIKEFKSKHNASTNQEKNK